MEETPSTVRGLYRQYLAFSVACVAMFCEGNACGWVPPLVARSLKAGSEGDIDNGDLSLTADEGSWLVALISVGGMLANLPAGHLMDVYGRKAVLLMASPLFAGSWIVALCSSSIGVLYTVRIMQGLAAGCVNTALGVFVGEVAHTNIRGAVTTAMSAVWTMGVMFEYMVAPYLTYWQVAVVSLTCPIAFAVTFVWFPESPHYLLLKGHSKLAAESLAWYRGVDSLENVREEMTTMKAVVYQREEHGWAVSWYGLFASRQGFKCFLMVHALSTATVFGGGLSILMYAAELFPSTSTDQMNFGSIAVCILAIVAILITALIIDQVGRRPLIMYCSWGTALFTGLSSCFYYLESEYSFDNNVGNSSEVQYSKYINDSSTLQNATVLVAVLFNSSTTAVPSLVRVNTTSGTTPIPGHTPYYFIIQAFPYFLILPTIFLLSIFQSVTYITLRIEMFPTETRALASALISASNSLMFIASVKLFQQVTDHLALYINFLIFCASNVFVALLTYFYLPETSKKSFGDIQCEMK